MHKHGIGPTEAATIIVREVAPTMSPRARADLLGPWIDTIDQIKHLRDVLRKR